MSLAVQLLFRDLRATMLTPAEKQRLVQDFYARELKLDWRERVEAGQSPDASSTLDFTRRCRPSYATELKKHSAVGNSTLARWGLDEAIERENLPIKPGSGEYNELGLLFMRGAIEAAERQLERDKGNWSGHPSDPLLATGASQLSDLTNPASSTLSEAPTQSISGLYEHYLTERRDLADATRVENRQYILWFEEFVGSKPLKAVTKRDVIGWKDALLRFPSQATKIFPGKSFTEILRLNEKRGATSIAHKTLTKYLSALRPFLAWAVQNEYLSQNPASGVNVRVPKRADARDPFDAEQLRILFGSPLFTGCKSSDLQGLTQPGSLKIWDERYWAPFIALFTGARAGEILQLLTEDVRKEGGIHFIDITTANDDRKSLKTANSARSVPIHPALERLGFLDFVTAQKELRCERLFPNADVNTFSKFFNRRYLPRLGIKTKRLVFHSFRHTFITAARDAELSDSMIKALVGHLDTSVTSGYGRFSIQAKHAAICRLSYDDSIFDRRSHDI